MTFSPLTVAFAMIAAAYVYGCGANPGIPQQYGPSPNYSSTPCFDNCGGDANCQAYCTNRAGANPPFAPAAFGGGQPGR
jgi:hypothetical protein